jgi:hypothetical protein
MNTVKMCVAALVGFLLGAYFGHPTIAKANSGADLYIKKVSAGYNPDGDLASRAVVGFSCVKGDKGELDACYIAATH